MYKRNNFEPDFYNVIQVLEKKIPSRPTLFEFAFNNKLVHSLNKDNSVKTTDRLKPFVEIVNAFRVLGYDYATVSGWRTNTLTFPKDAINKLESVSQNQNAMISDWESFEKYQWPDANAGDYEIYYDLNKYLPGGMKLIASGNGGILETVIDIVGFENLCVMTLLDETLTKMIFDYVGERFLRFYEIVASIETVGACIVNDDWGFKNQTILSPEMLRQWVFPWHKKIVQVIHHNKKKAILHSCGQVKEIMNDIIFDMKYDAKHSFEDEIITVENFYNIYRNEISILGGIDLDFLARNSKEEIMKRSKTMLESGMLFGGYALGSGNSIPEYIPEDNFYSMISVVNDIKT